MTNIRSPDDNDISRYRAKRAYVLAKAKSREKCEARGRDEVAVQGGQAVR